MGMPGAGKGTQAELIAEAIGYKQFSTGNVFRTISRQDTPLGNKVRDIIDNGYLMPPDTVAEVVITAVEEYVTEHAGIVFDGTPRTVRESELVDEFFLEHGYGRPFVIYLDIDQQTMIERNTKRLFCVGASEDFPIMSIEDERKCQSMGGEAGRRHDDDPEKFMVRYNQFMKHTYPIIEKYKKENILHIINGIADPGTVFQDIMNVISLYDVAQK